jgi:hypothetical protein
MTQILDGAGGVIPKGPAAGALPGELTDADFQGCRWIAGEPSPLKPGMFCCAPTLRPGGSWCAKHRKIVWAYRRGSRRPEAA